MEALHVEARCKRKQNRISHIYTKETHSLSPSDSSEKPCPVFPGKRKAKVPKMTKGKIGKDTKRNENPTQT